MLRPKLRKVERLELQRGEDTLVVLRDPLAVSEPLALHAEFAPILDMLDGTRTIAQVRQSLTLRGVLRVSAAELDGLVADLSQAWLLDDDAFRARWAETLEAFVGAAERPARAAGVLYPAEPSELRAALFDPKGRVHEDTDLIGVICPHAPLELAKGVLDATLDELPMASEIDLVVVLATDHHPGLLPYAVTAKHYVTPLGEVETASDVVVALERRLPWIRREEVRHREAFSIELAAVVLQHLYGSSCPPIVPVLCGQTALLDQRDTVDGFLAEMEALYETHRCFLWGSAELSHAGPAYGLPEFSSGDEAAVIARDHGCLDALLQGRPDHFARRCMEAHPQGRPSGAAAITTLLRLLPVGYRAELARYEARRPPGPADGRIGLAGIRLHAP